MPPEDIRQPQKEGIRYGEKTRSLDRRDWFTKKAGFPTFPEGDIQNRKTNQKLYKLIYFGLDNHNLLGSDSSDISTVTGYYYDVIEQKLKKNGQLCVIQDQKDNIIEIYLKFGGRIIDILKLAIKDGRPVKDFI